MQGFPYTRFLLYGFLTYATIFMLWSLLAAYGMSYGLGAQIVSYAVTALALAIATRALPIGSLQFAILAGLGWTILHMALDAVYVVRSAGFSAFLSSYVWIDYAVVALSPVAIVFYMNLPKKADEHLGADVPNQQRPLL